MLAVPFTPPAYATSSAVSNPTGYVSFPFPFSVLTVYLSLSCGHLYCGVLFVYSLPTIAAEQCYIEIIRAARTYLANYFIEADKFEAYQVLLDTIEEYNDNVLVKKSYWKSPVEEEEYKKFFSKWSELKKLARIDYNDFKKQREVLFVKNDLKYIKKSKIKLEQVRKYYRDRLLQLHALRRLSNKYQNKPGKWITRRRQKADEFIENLANEEVSKKNSIENIQNKETA